MRYAAAIRWLQTNPGWFLILDNLDSENAAQAAEDLLAQLSGGHVVLTSRLANWSGSVERLALDVLTVADAADVLLARTESKRRAAADDSRQARELAVELGQLALALEQAGAYICQRRLTLAGYRTAWQEQHDKVIEWFDERVMKYPCSVAITWQTTVNQLTAATRQLLQMLAWFGPEAIPESLMESFPSLCVGDDTGVAGVESSSPQSSNAHSSSPQSSIAHSSSSQSSQLGARKASTPGTRSGQADIDPYDLLAELDAWSLVTRQGDSPTFSVHRLIQDVTRRSLRGEPEHASLMAAFHWINHAFEADWNDVVACLKLEPLLGHGEVVAKHADEANLTAQRRA